MVVMMQCWGVDFGSGLLLRGLDTDPNSTTIGEPPVRDADNGTHTLRVHNVTVCDLVDVCDLA